MVYLYDLIANTSIIISVLLAILLIFKFNHFSAVLKVVGIYIIVSASLDIVSTSLYYQKGNNLMFLHLFTLFEIVILSYLFKKLFTLFKSDVNVLYFAIPATIFIIINAFVIQGVYAFNSYSSVLSSILIIGYCIHFFLLILEIDIHNIRFTTLKWFVICLFFYHSTSLIVMLFGSIIQGISREAQSYIWLFRSVVILTTKIILSFYFVKLLLSKYKYKMQ